MYVGTLVLRLGIEYANSLKDKRQVIKSLKERIRLRFNVSCAEIGALNLWRRGLLGVSVVSNDGKLCDAVLQKVVKYVEDDGRAVIDDYMVAVRQIDDFADMEIENDEEDDGAFDHFLQE